MSTSDYWIEHEPRGAVLQKLLEAGAGRCDRFMVALSRAPRSVSTKAFLSAAEPFLIDCRETTTYPSRDHAGEVVTVCEYVLTDESLRLLNGTADSLYDWQEPWLPNDLCLMRGDDPWLMTTTSCCVGILVLEPGEADYVRQQVPNLALAEH